MQKRRYYQYQCFMGGVELLQDLVHDGVGQVGDHRQLHLPERSRAEGQPPPVEARNLPPNPQPGSLQSSVDVLRRSLHQGVADAGARDGHLLGDGGKRRVEPLGGRAGHGTELPAEGHHGVHHHLGGGERETRVSHARGRFGASFRFDTVGSKSSNDQMSGNSARTVLGCLAIAGWSQRE